MSFYVIYSGTNSIKKRKRHISSSSSNNQNGNYLSTMFSSSHSSSLYGQQPLPSFCKPYDSGYSCSSIDSAIYTASGCAAPAAALPSHLQYEHEYIDLTSPPDYDVEFNMVYQIKQEKIQSTVQKQQLEQLHTQHQQDLLTAQRLQQLFDEEVNQAQLEDRTHTKKKKRKYEKKRKKKEHKQQDE